MGTVAIMASFPSLPRELFDSVFSKDNLSFDDIKSFSRCSKACRFQILPLLFRGIRLNPDSARALSNKGSLVIVRRLVRCAKLETSNKRFSSRDKWGFWDLVQECRVYLNRLEEFTNLRTIELKLSLPRFLSLQILCIVFKSMSDRPGCSILRKIVIDSQDYHENNTIVTEHRHYLNTLTDSEKKSLEHGIIVTELPKFVQESFCIEEITYIADNIHFGGSAYARVGSPSFGEILVNASATTLKRLELSLATMTDFDAKKDPDVRRPIFHNVTFLSVNLRKMDDHDIAIIAYRFPNLEEFRAWPLFQADFSVKGDVAYRDIVRMEKLKRVFLLRQSGPGWKTMTRKELQTSVEYWIGLGRDSALPRLSSLGSVEFSVDEPQMSIRCSIPREAVPRDASSERYKPITRPLEDDEGFKDLAFDWQTITKPFWERVGDDPELVRPGGVPLLVMERELDKYSGRMDGWPPRITRFILEYLQEA
ncbi:hypothetical protein EYR41_007252 [Orbilia oligospora]|uniref:Uncharacterized protein n=2 Tax=Orbilia oligospora TaxID=2813651 RepID=A0A7C8KFF9_ORBOL|nr:hypothetical protein TWF751_011072 [Orbilia oligospora]KAF3284453.1 hypothetical protein TWF132_009871 [Orbilia oligospora]TGJ68186.1 hypothetical protein EYR41_007252 [Orbilia oligospora]